MPHQTDGVTESPDDSKPVFLESDKMEEKDKKSDSTPRGDTINTNLLSHHLQTRALKNLQGGEIDDKVDQEITTKGSLKENGDISATEPSEDTDNYADGNAKNGINSTAATNGVTENRTNTSIQSGRNNDEKGSKSLVPKIEIFHKSSSNSSSSSDDEKSDSENEKKKRKVRTKRKGSNSSEDSPQHMRRRIKELEQVQVEYCEARTLLDALQEAKSELARELEIEKQKNKEVKTDPRRLDEDKQQLLKDLQETRAALEENNKELVEKETKLQRRDSTVFKLTSEIEALKKAKDDLEVEFEKLNSDDKAEAIRQFNQERIASLQKALREKETEVVALQANLDASGKRVQQLNAENSKLEAKLSNAKTQIDTHAGEIERVQAESLGFIERIKMLEEQNSRYKEKIKANSLSKTEREQAMNTQQKLNDRIKELEQKVIDVNGQNQKLQGEYQDALKALEAADQAYKQRDVVIEKYKGDIEEAEGKARGAYKEVEKTKKDMSKLEQDILKAKLELKKAEEREQEKRNEREELKNHVRRAKENSKAYQAELEDVHTDLTEMTHQLNMAQARAKERGKKNEMIQLELTEVKDTLQIAKSVIDEKEKNMESIKGSLGEEKERVKKLQQEIERLEHVQTKLQYKEEDKARLEIKLATANKDLTETKETLEVTTKRRKELEERVEHLEKENKKLKKTVEDCESEIKKLRNTVECKESELEEQTLEMIEAQGQLEEAGQQYDELWGTYEQDREKWEKWAKRAVSRGQGSRRRPKSAPPNRPAPPAALPGRYEMYSPAHKRLAQRFGAPRLNPSYINSCHKMAWSKQSPTGKTIAEKADSKNDGSTETEQLVPSPPSKPNPTKLENSTDQTKSPTPPKLRYKRPVSSYGIKSQPHPLIGRPYEDPMLSRGYYSDLDMRHMYMEVEEDMAVCDEEEMVAKNIVHKGDRVMIQSQIVGDSKLNVTGVVKFVGRVGKRIPSQSIYVGLKLDQPFGDNSGKVEGKQLFKCLPRHGKIVRLSDIHSVMNPRTLQYTRVRPVTTDHMYTL